MGLRSDLAAHLTAALAPPVVVYDYPVEVPIFPSVVLAPLDPYQAPMTFGRDGKAAVVLWGFRVQIMVPRTEASLALDQLEDRRKEVTDALATFPGATWAAFGNIGEVTNADVPGIGGTLDVTIKQGDNTE